MIEGNFKELGLENSITKRNLIYLKSHYTKSKHRSKFAAKLGLKSILT